MKIRSKSISAAFVLLLLVSVPALTAQDLVILHTNDTHSQIEEIRVGRGAGAGGVHRRAEYFHQVISQYGRDRVMLLDAGDYNQGTPYFTVFKGDLEMELMNALGYEVEPYVKPYTIVYKNGRKIGVFGLLANIKSLVAKQNREGLVYIDAYEAAQRWADYLKNEEHCDLVIALSHLGYSGYPNQRTDINLARNTRNIDVIIGGHSHTFLKSEKIYPNLDGEDVIIVQAGAQGEYVGRLDITFD